MKIPTLPRLRIPEFWIFAPCLMAAVLMLLYPATGMVLSLTKGQPYYDLITETKVVWSILSIPVTFGMYKLLRRHRHDDNDN
jgi:TRAP-type C4-dicarboxylate transport system permease small subunit